MMNAAKCEKAAVTSGDGATAEERLLSWLAGFDGSPADAPATISQGQIADMYVALGKLKQLQEDADAVRVGTGNPATFQLEAWGAELYAAWGEEAWLVGSAVGSKRWRDVDVRIILPDTRFHRLFPGFRDNGPSDAWYSSVCSAFSLHGWHATGLDIDFQVQSETHASQYEGRPAVVLSHCASPAVPAPVYA